MSIVNERGKLPQFGVHTFLNAFLAILQTSLDLMFYLLMQKKRNA